MARLSTGSNAILTDPGRELCEQLTEELYAKHASAPYEGWKQLAAIYDFGWSVGSGNRVAGRLPSHIDGEPLVRSFNSYVLKIEFGTSADDSPIDRSNWLESMIWKQATDRGVSDLFAPIIEHADDYRWLVMEEVETIGYDHPNGTIRSRAEEKEQQRRDYERDVATFDNRLADAGLGLGLDGEGQIGISASGTVVALDYEHVFDKSNPDQPAWIGSYDPDRGRRITPEDIDDSGQRERLRRIADGSDGSVTGYEIRSRFDQWRS
jgi:hypothetical protein